MWLIVTNFLGLRVGEVRILGILRPSPLRGSRKLRSWSTSGTAVVGLLSTRGPSKVGHRWELWMRLSFRARHALENRIRVHALGQVDRTRLRVSVDNERQAVSEA
jgi:hypothetical protein